MDLNLLFSFILFTLIGVLIVFSFRVVVVTQWNTKVFKESYLRLQNQLSFEQLKQEQVIQKNAYLENYNKSLLNQLFEITKELLITKKIIFEEHYN
ncbi:hypothetical protein [Xanthomarina sp. F2636L]|uniref:hypothetical protein n=1 Tax=Xanthomarina sp. F2636L TaxID=2996018 RepID=UPI00225E147D|nr:hypothetical protein [Xanthomarina sp. F2636L]MCX7552066.1 hypothetical protein [Xanthomarina sp. F2636L]